MNDLLHWADNHVHVDRYLFETAAKDLIAKMDEHLENCESCRIKVKNVMMMYLAIREYSREDIKHFITINDYIEQKTKLKQEKKVKKKINYKQLLMVLGVIIFLVSAFLLLRNMDIEPVAIVTDGNDGYLDGTISKTKTNDPVASNRSGKKNDADTLSRKDLDERSYIRVPQYKKREAIRVFFEGPDLKKTTIFPYSFKVKFKYDPMNGDLSELVISKHKDSFGNLSPEAKEMLNDQIEIIFTNKIRYRNSIEVPYIFIKQ
jgi:hypothetical protein